MKPVEVLNDEDLKAEIFYDECGLNPRKEFDNLGTIVCLHRRYDLGDEHTYRSDDHQSWDDLERTICEDHDPAVILPLYLMDHSGLSLSVGCDHFLACDSMGWDWGQVGFIFVPKEKVRREWSVKRISPKLRDTITRNLISEVDEYGKCLNGEVFGYVLKKGDDELDSCWGFIGLEFVYEEARRVMDYHVGRRS